MAVCSMNRELQRFNRTFMELKALMLQILLALVMFQSHLYGIESTAMGCCYVDREMFQSHLYGIESMQFE